MTEEEHRHGMSEFHSRMAVMETKVQSMQNEISEFKRDFHDHDEQEARDRKEIISQLGSIQNRLSKFDGWKGGVLFAVAIVGGLLALAFKKLFGG